jgi:GTP-binding protein
VVDQVYELFIDLDAHDQQLDFPVLYAVGKNGIATESLDEEGSSLVPLLDTIVDVIPPTSYSLKEPFQMLVSDISYSDYLGRLAIGKVVHGCVKAKEQLVCIGKNEELTQLNVSKLQVYKGPELQEVPETSAGEIVVLAGIDKVHIGDTMCTRENPKALKRINVDEPTVLMRFTANNGPYSGREGKYVQSSRIKERLERELLKNVSLQLKDIPGGDGFIVMGRGEFQIAILIEHLFIDCEESFAGIVTEKLSKRKGRMTAYVNHESGRIRLEFSVPSRALIGYRDEFLTDTRGTGIMNSTFRMEG